MTTTKEDLPIDSFRESILQAVRDHQVVVVTAETGAGKSTQVPQYLLSEGYEVVVTQPRRLAARSVAARVAEEMGTPLGGVVGFRTAFERKDSRDTRCLFCTDGLALVRELVKREHRADRVLVLDEVHEWNENMEVLIAWAKSQIDGGHADFRLVVMSATMESERLAAFFGGAQVIDVPGRMFPVEEREPKRNLVDEVAALLQEGRNVLVFQPGKKEIAETIEELQDLRVNAEILPLHGDLSPEDQQRCFRKFRRPKCVVSTNVAQTSVTIADIDAVVDSGMERRIELVNGVEGLYLGAISQADSKQRKGRAGRTKPGVYLDFCPEIDRRDFPMAEILRRRLDQTVLRLAVDGFDMAEMEFFHQPPMSEIRAAKATLVALGCMDGNGNVTQTGRRVNMLPVSVKYARMIVEADKRGVVDDVLTIAALMEVGGVTIGGKKGAGQRWRSLIKSETRSDVMAQTTIFLEIEKRGLRKRDEFEKFDVHGKAVARVREIRQHLRQSLKGKVDLTSSGDRNEILKSVCAGMIEHLFCRDGMGRFSDSSRIPRQLAKESVISMYEKTDLLVAEPWDLQVKDKWGGTTTLQLMRMASAIDPSWLLELAPGRIRQERLRSMYDPSKDAVMSETMMTLDGRIIGTSVTQEADSDVKAIKFAEWVGDRAANYGVVSEMLGDPMFSIRLSGMINQDMAMRLHAVMRRNMARDQRAKALNQMAGTNAFPVFTGSQVQAFVLERLAGATCMADVTDPEVLTYPPLDEAKVVEIENRKNRKNRKAKRSSNGSAYWQKMQSAALDGDDLSKGIEALKAKFGR